MKPLPRAFLARSTLEVARALVGARLVRRAPGGTLVGRIVETEAYLGTGDPASHARTRAARSEIMWGVPETAYVYLSCGVHFCLNVMAEREGVAGAVLVRAVEPESGNAQMRAWRQSPAVAAIRLAAGPGRLTRAFGIDLSCRGWDLARAGDLFIAAGRQGASAARRIGIRHAAEAPCRFLDSDSPSLSRRP